MTDTAYDDYPAQTAALRGGVERSVSDLDREVAQAHELVSRLTDALAPALRPERPTQVEAVTSEDPSTAPLTAAVCDQTRRLRLLSGRLSDLLDRLDL